MVFAIKGTRLGLFLITGLKGPCSNCFSAPPSPHATPIKITSARFTAIIVSSLNCIGGYHPARALAFAEDVPIGQGRHPIGGLPASYVCRNRRCDTPVTRVQALIECCTT